MSFLAKIKSACVALAPDCREASRTQSNRIDGPLPAGKRLGLFLHLLICKWCRRYGRQIGLLHEATREHAEDYASSAPQKLSEAARERIKQNLRDQK